MFKAVGNYVWATGTDGTDSVVAVTMGHVSAESIAAGLNLLRATEILESREQTQREIEKEVERVNEYILYGKQKKFTDDLRQAMREDVAQLRKIIHRQPQEVS
jgi:ribosomal protein S13